MATDISKVTESDSIKQKHNKKKRIYRFQTPRFPPWTMTDRINLYGLVTHYLKRKITNNYDFVCINDNGNHNLHNFFSSIRSLSLSNQNIHSDNYVLEFPRQLNYTSLTTPMIALKIIPLNNNERLEMYNTKYEIWREITAMKLVTNLVRKRMTPHMPMIYQDYICNNCTYQNPKINQNTRMCVLMLNELADMDLQHWIIRFSKQQVSRQLRTDVWLTVMFQIWVMLFYAILAFELRHNDFHWGNILINICDDDINTDYSIDRHRCYVVNGVTFYVPNHRVLAKLWDFGRSFSITKFCYNPNEFNYHSYSTLHNRDLSHGADVSKIHNLPSWIEELESIKNKDVMPENIRNMLNSIKTNVRLGPYGLLLRYMTAFLHNRIGTNVTSKDGAQKIRNPDEVQTGKLVTRHDTGMIGVVIDRLDNNFQVIWSRQKGTFVEPEFVNTSMLSWFPDGLPQVMTGKYAYLKHCIHTSIVLNNCNIMASDLNTVQMRGGSNAASNAGLNVASNLFSNEATPTARRLLNDLFVRSNEQKPPAYDITSNEPTRNAGFQSECDHTFSMEFDA